MNPVFGNVNIAVFAGVSDSCQLGLDGNGVSGSPGIEAYRRHSTMPWAAFGCPHDLHRQEYSQADPYPDRGSSRDDGQPQWTGAGKAISARIITGAWIGRYLARPERNDGRRAFFP